MKSAMTRIEQAVVTGLGCVTALGDSVSQFWESLVVGASGISPISGFNRDHMRNPCAGEIHLSPQMIEYARDRKIRSRLALFAAWAIEEALKESGLSNEVLRTKKVGLVLGVSCGMALVKEEIDAVNENAGASDETFDDLSDFAGELADRLGIRGEALTVSTACAAGTNAIGIARDMIVLEGYDAVVCGGSDTLDRMKYLGHSALNTLTPNSIQPFGADRDGTIFGEGSGILLLESSRSLNGKKPLAVCAGSGFSCDAHHVTAPDPEGAGAIHAINGAFRDSGLTPGDIDYINLHGSGTPHNDSVESLALSEVFGSAVSSIPVSSIKAAIGHAMGAAGACEAVATVLSIVHDKVPPTVNTREKDPSFPVHLVCGGPMNWRIDHALSNSFGFGGCNGTVIFSKWTS
jgi:3-oxoacyl-[acyl-carrier-protein] synthase II